MNEVQDLVDFLATRLDRPVGLDDRRFRAIAYSSHPDEIDEVRRISILGRQAPDVVIHWLETLGLMQAREVLDVPANPDLSMVARVCVPVRFHDRLLGFLWLIAGDAKLTDAELDLCRAGATEIAEELYRLRQQTDEERRLEGNWVRQVTSGKGVVPTSAVPGIAADSVYAVLVVTATLLPGSVPPTGVDVRMTEAIDQMRRSVAPRHQMATCDHLRATVVLAASNAAEVERHAAALLTAAETELGDVAGVEVRLGIGEPVGSIAALADSSSGAHHAVRLATSMPELGPLVKWSELGAMRLLSVLVGDRDPQSLIPAPLRRLLADADGELLTRTLEAYLEHAGDVAAAAAELFIHRSSLYNRLQRIEEVAQVDIRSGGDRLELHLGIRLWRMGGVSPRRSV